MVDVTEEVREELRRRGLTAGPDGPITPADDGPLPSAARRAADILVSGAALILIGPLLLVLMWLVQRESPGGAIFRQRRGGLHGEPFEVLKLRTMVAGADRIGPGLAIDKDDARITKLGKLLRRTSLDELPQLVNVLKGDMALVGPRPTLLHQVAAYDDRQRERLLVKPGVTGWAQVNGRTSLSWPERIELDRWYVAHRSVQLDLLILLRSVQVVLGGEGVQREGRAWTGPPPS